MTIQTLPHCLFILVLIVCEDYDVYIIYASPDKPFADELLTKLEEKPYSFRVCIDHRDFLPGSRCGKLETSTEVIEKGCKVLLIMSENFNRCESADFEAKIALKISPGLFISGSY